MARYDHVVIGGGPAGVAAAIGLAREGARVALIERCERPRFKPGEIIDPTIQVPLAQLGLQEAFRSLSFPLLSGSLTVWDDEHEIDRPIVISPFGHGFLVDRNLLEDWLLQTARLLGVRVFLGAVVRSVERRLRDWSLNAGTEQENFLIETSFLIEATGRGRGVVAPPLRSRSVSLVALMAYVRRCDGADQRLRIEACRNGWWYAAALPQDKAVLAFVTRSDLLPKAPDARAELFRCSLDETRIVRPLAGGQTKMRLRGHPCGASIREVFHGDRWVAIGEAAAAYDPLSGQGIPAALAKGAAIARLLARSQNNEQDVASYVRAEHRCFAAYLATQHSVYQRGAKRWNSDFWSGMLA